MRERQLAEASAELERRERELKKGDSVKESALVTKQVYTWRYLLY